MAKHKKRVLSKIANATRDAIIVPAGLYAMARDIAEPYVEIYDFVKNRRRYDRRDQASDDNILLYVLAFIIILFFRKQK